jgi:hypothetical protein
LGKEYIRLVDEGLPGDSVTVFESMPSRERENQALRQEALAHQHLALHRRPKNPDMDAPGLESRYLLCSCQVA